MTQQAVFTPEELAGFLKVSEFTIRRMLRTGEIAGFKVGRQWRVSRTDLHAYMCQHGSSGLMGCSESQATQNA